MRTLPLLPILLFSLLPVAARAATPEDITVGGISTTMSPDKIKETLGPEWELGETVVTERGKVFNFTKGEEAFNILTLGTRIVFIQHLELFPADARLAASDLPGLLEAKYGKPSATLTTSGPGSAVWLLDKQGTVLGGPDNEAKARTCAGYESRGPFPLTDAAKVSFQVTFPAVPMSAETADCGTVIVSRAYTASTNPGLISQLAVSVFDIPGTAAWFGEETAAFDKKQHDEVDAARKNKPHL